MNNLSIRTKFLILGIVVLTSFLLLTILSLNFNQKGFDNLQNVVTDFKKVQNIQSDFIEPLFVIRETILTLVMSPNDEYKQRVNKKLIPLITTMNTLIQTSSTNVIQDKWKIYQELLITTRQYALEGFDEGSFMNSITQERDAFYLLIDELRNLQKQRLDKSQKTFNYAEKIVSQSHYYLIIGFILTTLISFLFDSIIVKRIIDSIEKVEHGLQSFFLYLRQPKKEYEDCLIKINTNDELGKMAQAINQRVAEIKNALQQDDLLIKEATETVNNLKEGKFGQRLKRSADDQKLNALKDVMNAMINNLEQKIQEEIARRTDQEKLLVQQSKLAAIGNMIGNIAHQWRQPISEINAILIEVEAISRYHTLTQEVLLQHIELCYDVTEHMSQTICDFQNFFKPSKNKEIFSVLNACDKAISIISASLKFNNINLVYSSSSQDSQILGYPNEFSHAILNILSNAKDIIVERKIKNPCIRFNIKIGRKYTIIRIEDNGGGVIPENIERIFEPYFTTKYAKQGTGIGLYMTKSIIENNMRGFINVENTDKGALFTIKIH